jgi:dihydroneopterin aldolase
MTTHSNRKIEPLRSAAAKPARRRVFVRDLMIDSEIGVHGHERGQAQPVRLNVDLLVDEDGPLSDRLEQVVCYEAVVTSIRSIVSKGHIVLVETLAEQIAQSCLADGRVAVARIRVEKLTAIPEAASAGVEITRYRADVEEDSARF